MCEPAGVEQPVTGRGPTAASGMPQTAANGVCRLIGGYLRVAEGRRQVTDQEARTARELQSTQLKCTEQTVAIQGLQQVTQ